MWIGNTGLNSHCEKVQIWRGRERLPYTVYMKGQNNKRCCRREGENYDVGENPASQYRSPYPVRDLQLQFSLFRRQALATSPSNDYSWCDLKSIDLVNNYSKSSHLPFAGRCPWLIFISLVTPEELLLWLSTCLPFCIATGIPTLCLWAIVEKPKTDCFCRVL